ncbi:PH domain-containing protein [Sphingomonas sp. LY29]|uniref:PH domain-containing protein n=1 Tax=Sphingomonas sp. LY29 TaxID=3095341 RepID=UPI002D772C57|nr:PH domain-containing protein [Sphingomonas sp. LY29]WRP26913.1 PH domain-containing protein [Sphingomonas sp. LY29]
MTVDPVAGALHPVEPAYRNVLRTRAALFWVPIFVGALAVRLTALEEFASADILPVVIGLIGLSGITIAPNRVYRRLGYAIDGGLLRVVRGWLFHVDTVVPFVRVQHIDVKRGPMDKLFGTASLVVHTAGTHNSIVTLPGLSPTRAADIRDDIRADIRSDAE